MSKSAVDGIASNDLQLHPFTVNPEIDEKILQAFSFIMGWHSLSKSFKRVLVDTDGRLLVSSSPTQTDSAVQSQVTATVAAALALQSNPNRKQYIIQNLGSSDIYIGYTSSVSVLTAFKIPSNGVFADDVYTGAIWVVSGTGSQDVRFTEM